MNARPRLTCTGCGHTRARHRWSARADRVPDDATEHTISYSLSIGVNVIAYTWRCVAPCTCPQYQPPSTVNPYQISILVDP